MLKRRTRPSSSTSNNDNLRYNWDLKVNGYYLNTVVDILMRLLSFEAENAKLAQSLVKKQTGNWIPTPEEKSPEYWKLEYNKLLLKALSRQGTKDAQPYFDDSNRCFMFCQTDNEEVRFDLGIVTKHKKVLSNGKMSLIPLEVDLVDIQNKKIITQNIKGEIIREIWM